MKQIRHVYPGRRVRGHDAITGVAQRGDIAIKLSTYSLAPVSGIMRGH